MKDTAFHRPLQPLTSWEDAGLQAFAQIWRDTLMPGCSCVGPGFWGHTVACKIQSSYRDDAEQTLGEATELRLVTGRIEANIPAEFSHIPGWGLWCRIC